MRRRRQGPDEGQRWGILRPMQSDSIRRLLEEVQRGDLSVDAAFERLRHLPFEDLDDLKIDHHRALRTGFPETVFGGGKSLDQVVRALTRITADGGGALATRLSPEMGEALSAQFSQGRWHAAAGIFEVLPREPLPPIGHVAVVAAGTSDLSVAEEAAVTARAFGARVETAYDVGVAGLHRLLAHRTMLGAARVVVVVAGMEGALASVVAGLVSGVVVAVPTSVGYGASFHGLAALLAMLNSCGSGVLVCNIDNGFGAGVAAARINRLGEAPEGAR